MQETKKINSVDSALERIKSGEVISVADLLKADILSKEWWVEGLLPKGDLTILAGKPGHFKSFLAMELAVCCATGRNFLKFVTKPSRVLYVDEENGEVALKERFTALMLGHGLQADNLEKVGLLIFPGLKINTDKGQKRLKQLVERHKPDVVVLDSLIRVFEGDENASKDMKRVFDTLKTLMAEHGTTFLLIHHVRKGKGKVHIDDVRGSSDIVAGASSVMMINRTVKRSYKLTQEKNRHKAELSKGIEFTVSDKETLEGTGIEIAFLRETESYSTTAEYLEGELKSWLTENFVRGDVFKSGKAYKQFNSYTQGTVLQALKKLAARKKLKPAGRGIWVVY